MTQVAQWVSHGSKKGSMVFNVHRNHKKGGGMEGGGGKREITHLSLHCHHQKDLRFEVGSDENHFNVS